MKIAKDDLQKYVDKNMTQREIAQATGIPEPTVAWTMRRYGIRPAHRQKDKPSKEEIESLYHGEGLSVRSVAKRLGRSESSVPRWMRKYGIKSRPVGTNHTGDPITTDVFASRLEPFGHRLIGEYKGSNERVKYQCRCGRESEAFPAVLLRGGGCKACASEMLGRKKRLPESTVAAEMDKNGDAYQSMYYKDGLCRVVYRCSSCGSDADVLWQNYRRGQKCGGCRKLQFTGENNPNWNPDLTDYDRLGLGRYKEGYKSWAKHVKARDGFTCQVCRKRGSGDLVSHHLNAYGTHESLRTNVDNGVTMCEGCHKEFHAVYGYGKNTEQQFKEFRSRKED